MNQESINKDVLERLTKLENAVFLSSGSSGQPKVAKLAGSKTRTLPEIIRENTPKNGQGKVAAVVGYCEHELGLEIVSPEDIRNTWRQAKLDGSYAPIYLSRAIGEGLVNDYGKKGSYVLTQSGEAFYQNL